MMIGQLAPKEIALTANPFSSFASIACFNSNGIGSP